MSVRPKQFRTRAVSLPLVLLFSALLLILSLTDCLRVQQALSTRNSREKALQADYAAQTGLQRAVGELSLDSNWAPALFIGTLSSRPGLSFEVEVVNNFNSASPTTAPDGSDVPAGRVWLRSRGLVDGKPMAGGLGTAKSVPVKPSVVFDQVIDERRSLYLGKGPSFTGCLVDSYSGGPPTSYAPYLVPGDPGTYRRAARFHSSNNLEAVQTGFVDAEPIASSESVADIDPAHCSGALTIDPTWPPYWKFRVPAAVATMPMTIPPSSGGIPPGRYGSLNVPASSNVTLGPGRYYFKTLNLGLDATLTLDPTVSDASPCEIYIGETLLFEPGARANPDHPPRHLQIYSTDEKNGYTELTFEDDSRICATITGLGAEVRFENRVEMFGAMKVYDFYEGADSKIHYDESLAGQVLEGSAEWVLVDQSSQ